MNCPDKGIWQAFLDQEVSKTEKEWLKKHAEECSQCRKTIDELCELENWTLNPLTKYQLDINENISNYYDLKENSIEKDFQNRKTKVRGRWMSSKFKKWTSVAASVLLLTGVLSFSPVQEAVADFLSIFRVQKLQTVKVSPAEMEQIARDIETKVGEVDLKEFGKVEVTQKPEQVKVAFEQAQTKLPFTLRKPAYLPEGFSMPGQVNMQKEGKAEFKLNVEQANSLLRGLGSQTLLPATLEGKSFGIGLPAGVHMFFNKDNGHNGISLAQYATPEVVVPSGVDAGVLRAALLDLPILPEDFRKQLASIEDWQNTMIIPDTGEEKIEKLTIAGNEAIFTQYKDNYSNLMWVDNGVIFQLSGPLDREEIIKMAQSIY